MKLYLSSYRLGDEPYKFSAMFTAGAKVGYVPNALDFSNADPERRLIHIDEDMDALRAIGLEPIEINLARWFGDKEFESEIQKLDGLWVSGGNVFILRQAMKLSGLDDIMLKDKLPVNFVYGGYSAGACVLSPTLKAYSIVDDSTDFPYRQQREQIWEGLDILDDVFMPHFDSDHPESDGVGKAIEFCKTNNISFTTLRDGEVMVL